jgi:hypothetical protein
VILIRFNDAETERKALGFLTGRFSFKTWKNGDLVVPETALSQLAMEGIQFIVKGPAPYERTLASLRNSPASAV